MQNQTKEVYICNDNYSPYDTAFYNHKFIGPSASSSYNHLVDEVNGIINRVNGYQLKPFDIPEIKCNLASNEVKIVKNINVNQLFVDCGGQINYNDPIVLKDLAMWFAGTGDFLGGTSIYAYYQDDFCRYIDMESAW